MRGVGDLEARLNDLVTRIEALESRFIITCPKCGRKRPNRGMIGDRCPCWIVEAHNQPLPPHILEIIRDAAKAAKEKITDDRRDGVD